MKTKPYKILFIKPCADIAMQFIEIPLAFLYLSSYLKANSNEHIRIEMIDLRMEPNPADALVKKLALFSPDLIGISLLAMDRGFLSRWGNFIRSHAPNASIIIGGPYATFESDAALVENPQVDCAVIGEGEKTFLNLVTALKHGRDIFEIKGIAFVRDNKPVCNEPEPFIENLDDIPFPDYDILGFYCYYDTPHLPMNAVIAEKQYTIVISSRGCPYGCVYCHSMFGKKVRKRSPGNFVAEIKWLYEEFGIREFHIIDDIFNIDRKRMHEILHGIIGHGLNIRIAFANGLRGDLLTRGDILLLKQAGTYMLTFSVETASKEMQQVIQKNLDIDRVLDNIAYASEIGILTRGTFLLGFPGESVESIRATIALAKRSQLDMAAFFSVMAFPNTALDYMVRRMYPLYKADDVIGCFWDAHSFYQRVTGYNLKRTQNLAYLKFYLPFRIVKTFAKLPCKRAVLISWSLFAIYLLAPDYVQKRFFGPKRIPLLTEHDGKRGRKKDH